MYLFQCIRSEKKEYGESRFVDDHHSLTKALFFYDFRNLLKSFVIARRTNNVQFLNISWHGVRVLIVRCVNRSRFSINKRGRH